MNLNLVVLCSAAFVLLAASLSAVIALTLPGWDRLAKQLSARHRAHFWAGIATLPALTALLAVAVSLLPALGVGDDHCLAHSAHHPHLCPRHLEHAPGLALQLLALVLGLRLACSILSLSLSIRTLTKTLDNFSQVSENHGDARVFPSNDPQAFVLGLFRPRIYISQALLALGPTITVPVLAHERVHARRRDILWRILLPALGLGHIPFTLKALRARHLTAQELAADAEGAATIEDGRLKIAEALLFLTRLGCPSPPPVGTAFTHAEVELRVRALLQGEQRPASWPAFAVVICALSIPIAMGSSYHAVHHGLETMLGALSQPISATK